MSVVPNPAAYGRDLTFREYLDTLAKPRGVANNGVERAGVLSRPLRHFVRSSPPDHNLEDLLGLVPDELRDELLRIGELYAAATTPPKAMVAEAISAELKRLGARRRRRERGE
jgi:hypothetical protein